MLGPAGAYFVDVMHEQSAQVMAGNAYVFCLLPPSALPVLQPAAALPTHRLSISVRTQHTNFTTCHCAVHTPLQRNSQHPQRDRYLCPPPTHQQDRSPMDGRPHCYLGLARFLVSLSFRSHISYLHCAASLACWLRFPGAVHSGHFPQDESCC